MTTKRTPISRVAREPLSDGVRQLLETGEPGPGDWEAFVLTRDTAAQRAVWRSVQAEILSEWTVAHPGTRPAAWWAFDAPEPQRRRLGGIGTARSTVMAVEPSLKFGLDLDFVDEWNVQYYNGRATDIHGRPIGREFHEGTSSPTPTIERTRRGLNHKQLFFAGTGCSRVPKLRG